MERIIDRLDTYMNYSKLNDNKITVQLGLSVGLIGKSRLEGHDLGKKTIEKVLNFYTDLNRAWLLSGYGEMLNITEDKGNELHEDNFNYNLNFEDKAFKSQNKMIDNLLKMVDRLNEENNRLTEEVLQLKKIKDALKTTG